MSDRITASERDILRTLAKQQREYANLPVMAERERLWYLHNHLQGERPMVVMEEDAFIKEMLPLLRCENAAARQIEARLLQTIAAHEQIGDDKVVPDFYAVFSDIDFDFLGPPRQRTSAQKGVGFHIDPVIETLPEDLSKLRDTLYVYDKEKTERKIAAAQDVLGDILPVVYKNNFVHWNFGITMWLLLLMGMENMFYAMATEPESFHKLMRMATDDLIRCLRWQEENNLLTLNNGNDYLGSGSYCFNRVLPGADFAGTVRSANLWGHLNSQESVGISPGMFAEFIFPYYAELAAQFGLVYYGCCEPVHAYWDNCLCNLPGLRKVSISAWCDEEMMGQRLQSGRVIYSRKPSPNFLGVERAFDEQAFTAHIQKTAGLAKGCRAEFIFRDVYSLHGNPEKARRAVEITRCIAEEMY